jgi:hypothetical protein
VDAAKRKELEIVRAELERSDKKGKGSKDAGKGKKGSADSGKKGKGRGDEKA